MSLNTTNITGDSNASFVSNVSTAVAETVSSEAGAAVELGGPGLFPILRPIYLVSFLG